MTKVCAIIGAALIGLATACGSAPLDQPARADEGQADERARAPPQASLGNAQATRHPRGRNTASAPHDTAAPKVQARTDAASTSSMRDCYLKVDGVVRVTGRCRVFPMGKNEYTINTYDGGKPAYPHLAMVIRNPDGTGTATWNADPGDDRALDPLGSVTFDGGCWVNRRARICVR